MSKEALKDFILTIMVGSFVRGSVAELHGEDFEHFEKQVNTFLELAERLGYKDLIERFKGEIIPSNELGLEEEKIMEEYNSDEFWFMLQTMLGQRDFRESKTIKELQKLEKDFWLPDEVQKFYDKYSKEFEDFGIDRLRVVKKK